MLEAMQKDTINDIYALKQSLQSQHLIPSPWEEHFSQEHGIPYYFNPETGTSSWEPPVSECEGFGKDLTLQDLVEEEVQSSSPTTTPEVDFMGLENYEEASVKSASTVSRRVEDDLLKKGELYQSRRDELRRQEDERFAEEFTGRPQITRYAEKLYSSKGDSRTANMSIAERSKRMLDAKKAKEDKLRNEIDQRAQSEVGLPSRHACMLLLLHTSALTTPSRCARPQK